MERWPYSDKRSLEWDARYGLEQVVETSIQLHVEWLLLAGDNFNTRHPTGDEVRALLQQVARAESAGVQVGFNQGQHCMQVVPWPALLNEVAPAGTWLHKAQIPIGDYKLYSLDWLPPDDLPDAFSKIPADTDILMMHQVWGDFMPPGQLVKPECWAKDVPGHIRLLISGDFHSHRDIAVSNAGGKQMSFLSPGPVCMQNLAEAAQKFFYVIYDDLTFESWPLKSRACYRYLLDSPDDLELFLKEHVDECVTPQKNVPDYIQTNLVEVRYRDDIPECRQRLLAVLDRKCHHFLKPVATTSSAPTGAADVPAIRVLNLTEAIQSLPDVSQAAKNEAIRLANCTGNISDELDRIKREFFEAFTKAQA